MSYKVEYSRKYYEKHKERIREYQKEYQKEYRKNNKEKIKEYQKEYQKEYYKLCNDLKTVRYALYDMDDNYIFEGTLKELSEYSGRPKASISSSISHLKNRNTGLLINGKRVRAYKMED